MYLRAFIRIYTYLQQLLLSALRAENVLRVRDEAFADERVAALRADEAVVVPVAVLERNEAGAAYAYKLFKKSFNT